MEAMVARYPAMRRFLSAHFSVSGAWGYSRTSWLEAARRPLEFLRGAAGAARGASGLPAMAGLVDTRRAVREMLRGGLARAASGEMACTDGRAIWRCSAATIAAGMVSAIRHAGSAAEIAPLVRGPPEWCGTEWRSRRISTIAAASGPRWWRRWPMRAYGWRTAMFGRRESSGESAALLDDVRRIGARRPAGAGTARHRGDLRRCRRRLPRRRTASISRRWPARRRRGSTPSVFPAPCWTGPKGRGRACRYRSGSDCTARRSAIRWATTCMRAAPSSTLRPLSGDASIFRQLKSTFWLELRDYGAAIPLLANDTLAHVPPLTFFRGAGAGAGRSAARQLRHLRGGGSPLRQCCARLRARQAAPGAASTLERLETALLDFPEGAEAYCGEAADAFRIGLYYQTLAGRDADRTGNAGEIRPDCC